MQCPNCRETEAGQWLFAGGEFGESIQDEGVEVAEIVNSEAFTSYFIFYSSRRLHKIQFKFNFTSGKDIRAHQSNISYV